MINEQQVILIVDDKEANLIALERLLENSDAKVVRASSGNDALMASLHTQFALAIVDVQMPEMDGFELARLLTSKSENQSLPIIFVSAVYTDPSHQDKAYGAGAIDFLVKPYDPEILLAKVGFFLSLDRQRKLLEDRIAIEESKNYLEGILAAMNDAVVVTSDDLIIKTVNHAAEKLLGLSQEKLIKKHLDFIFPNADSPAALRKLPKLKTAQKLRYDDVHLKAASGKNIPVILNVSCVGSEDKSGLGIVLTAIDITEQKEAEKARTQLEEQLRHAQRLESVGRLAGGVAHDFNNLLTVIFACCEFLAENLGHDDPRTTEVNDILEASTRGADLVRQLLAFGHKQILRPEIIEPNEIVHRTAQMLKRTVGEHIKVSTSLTNDLKRVSVDPVQLTQVLMNLGVNARDAMPHGGELSFTSSTHPSAPDKGGKGSTEAQTFRITVCDTGCGIEPRVLSRIFEPFYSTKKPGEGTGLGLSVVHGIIAQSGGRIAAESIPGEGSRFTIDLPLSAEQESKSETHTKKLHQHLQNGTVLVVDDDETIQKVVSRSLRARGYEVLQANNLNDALELGRRSKIEVLLTDVVMPVHSGPDVAQALLEETPEMTVIFMSGHAHDLLGHHGVETTQVSFIQKPFLPDTLLRLVDQVISGETKPVETLSPSA